MTLPAGGGDEENRAALAAKLRRRQWRGSVLVESSENLDVNARMALQASVEHSRSLQQASESQRRLKAIRVAATKRRVALGGVRAPLPEPLLPAWLDLRQDVVRVTVRVPAAEHRRGGSFFGAAHRPLAR